MNWFIVGMMIAAIAFIVGYCEELISDCLIISGFLVACIAIFIYAVTVIPLIQDTKNNYNNMQFEISSTEIYEISKIDENHYYYSSNLTNLNGKYIVKAIIKNEEGFYEEKKYETFSLKINPNANEKATIVVKKEKAVSAMFLGEETDVETLKEKYDIDISDVEIISEIIIHIPENEINISDGLGNMIHNQEISEDSYCYKCGEEVKETDTCCENCGRRIKD